MLQKKAVTPELLETLKELMTLKTTHSHRLVGGTALALQIGHRISVDIDLFSDKKNNYNEILEELSEKFRKNFKKGRYISSHLGKGISVFIKNIKTDILDWNSRFIKPPVLIEGIRLAHKEDIIPMKFNTFLCAPEFARYEKKDYIDIAVLLREYSLEKMLKLYKKKHPDELFADRMLIEGLLLYELAEKKIMPKMLIDFKWQDVKSQFERAVEIYNRKMIKK